MQYHILGGWAYLMLAAFLANADGNPTRRKSEWEMPLDGLVPAVIDDFVRICVTQHRDNNPQPDKVGQRESTYVQRYDKVSPHRLETGRDGWKGRLRSCHVVRQVRAMSPLEKALFAAIPAR